MFNQGNSDGDFIEIFDSIGKKEIEIINRLDF